MKTITQPEEIKNYEDFLEYIFFEAFKYRKIVNLNKFQAIMIDNMKKYLDTEERKTLLFGTREVFVGNCGHKATRKQIIRAVEKALLDTEVHILGKDKTL